MASHFLYLPSTITEPNYRDNSSIEIYQLSLKQLIMREGLIGLPSHQHLHSGGDHDATQVASSHTELLAKQHLLVVLYPAG